MKYIKLIFSILIITSFVILTTHIYGVNETEDLTLSRIYVEPGTLEPEFSESRDYYTLLLDPTVTNLTIQATPTNKDLYYEIKGNENLKEGENIITITVFSEDKLKNKVYTINALKTTEPDKYNALLSTLIIDNYPFNEEFFPEKFKYTLKDNIQNDMLEIFAYPQNSNATVKIVGNEDLKENSNPTITITVTSENGLSSRNYTIEPKIVTYPSVNDINNNNIETDINVTNNKNSEFKTFLITSLIIVTLLILIIYLNMQKNK